jgi:hypothetical protein
VIWDRGIVDSQSRIIVEESIRNTIKTTVLPCFCESGAHFSALMLKTRKLSTLEQRRDLFSAVTQAWNPEDVAGVAE